MKLYLSSYKTGNRKEELKEWIKNNGNNIGVIINSRDYTPDSKEKEESINKNILELEMVGFKVDIIDLKKYFGKENKLIEDLKEIKAFYVIGGNVFTLRLAMKYSGFDNFLKSISDKDGYLYAGYSAGICVLAPTFKGLDIVDDIVNPYSNEPALYEGLNLIDFVPVPHYMSDHPESEKINEVVKYYEKEKIKYKPLRDGDVVIIDL